MNSANGDEVEKTEHRKNLNPFATDEDDDSDDGEGDFTIGDLEVEEEGKRHLPPGTSLVGAGESLLHGDKNVGVLPTSSTASYANPRAIFPSLWPFGGTQRTVDGDGDGWGMGVDGEEYNKSRSHFRGANKANNNEQSSDEDSDEEFGSGQFGGDGQGEGSRRRLSVTTEAKRRTSLEDDDEDGVVHIALEVPEEVKTEGVGDDEELVEIQHAEMQGVETEASK